MRLKSNFITQTIEDTQFLIPLETGSFSGIIKNNRTAAFIVDCLKEETTETDIIDRLEDAFDAPREMITSDVRKVLETLRGIGAIEE